MADTEQVGAVREEDKLDEAALAEFLNSLSLYKGEMAIKQFSGGASNLTYLVDSGGFEMVLRRPPSGRKAKSAHDMIREARIMDSLKPHYPKVPEILAVCEDESILGTPFYIMQRMDGIILRRDIPEDMNLTEGQVRELCSNVLDAFIDLHAIEISKTELGWIGKGEGYTARQVEGWNKRFTDALTDDVDLFKDVQDWLEKNMPPHDVATCIIHNDWRFDNVVLDKSNPLEVEGVLDWEMATLGDPLMDLGATLAYWVEAEDDQIFHMMRRQPTQVAGMMSRDEVVAYYADRSGRTIDDFTFYEVYGLFRLAGIIQQIWWRYKAGQTTNPAFKTFGMAANYLGNRCRKIISERG